jgi:hypothetical protein
MKDGASDVMIRSLMQGYVGARMAGDRRSHKAQGS